MTLRAGSSGTGGVGGVHRVVFQLWGSSLSSRLCRCLGEGREGLLSSQHRSKAEKEPDISPGTQMDEADAGKLSQCNRRDVKGQGLRTRPNHQGRGGRAKSS